MKSIKFPGIVLVVVLLSLLAARAGLAEQIKIQAGISVFPDPRHAPSVYVEFPFSVHRNQFQFLNGKNKEDYLTAGIYAEIILSDTLGRPVDSAMTRFFTQAKDSSAVLDKGIQIFNRLSMLVEPGVYSARLTVIDIVGKGEGAFLYDRLYIDPVIIDRLNLSSLELAYRITVAAAEPKTGTIDSRLIKNNRKIIPNPMSLFSTDDSSLFIYAEIYNLSWSPDKSDSFQVDYRLLSPGGIDYLNYGRILQEIPGSTSVVTNVLDIKGFKPGRYDLQMIVKDLANNATDTAANRFIVIPKSGETNFTVSEKRSHPYDTSSVQTKINLARYFMAPQQLAMLETLNDVGKGRFIDQFFSDKDPDPATDKNEFLDAVYSRYIYTNEHFYTAVGANDGWQTDRGRVLLQYGVWDDKDDAMVPSMGQPWELWSYHTLQGGVVFVFQDQDGYGDFRLVHSTAKGELFDETWNNFLKDYDVKVFKEEVILPEVRND